MSGYGHLNDYSLLKQQKYLIFSIYISLLYNYTIIGESWSINKIL